MKLMKNGLVDYSSKWITFRKDGQLFRMSHGDRLTIIPITEQKPIGWLKRLWLTYAPEWYKRRVRHKSHMIFLDKLGVHARHPMRGSFGSEEYIAAEKEMVMKFPKPEESFNDFDPRPRTVEERAESIRTAIRSAFETVKSAGENVHYLSSDK